MCVVFARSLLLLVGGCFMVVVVVGCLRSCLTYLGYCCCCLLFAACCSLWYGVVCYMGVVLFVVRWCALSCVVVCC